MSGLKKAPRFFLEKYKLFTRNMTAEPHKKKPSRFAKIAFNMSGFNQYGLYHDDCLDPFSHDVEDALLRLPADMTDERNYRICRALHLSTLRIVLPKKKWITYEEDREYRYLQPYIDEIRAEKMEIYNFGCVNYHRRELANN